MAPDMREASPILSNFVLSLSYFALNVVGLKFIVLLFDRFGLTVIVVSIRGCTIFVFGVETVTVFLLLDVEVEVDCDDDSLPMTIN